LVRIDSIVKKRRNILVSFLPSSLVKKADGSQSVPLF
jgi:hypothetical protein